MTVVAHGPHIATWVNGVQVTDWTDTRPKDETPRRGLRTEAGTIQLQGHDPDTDLEFGKVSVRQIAAATGLSSSRVHQLLGSDEAREIPRWLSQQRRRGRPSQPDVPARLAGELEALRRCREWLERLDRGEQVVVNLRPETDPETEYVAFDRPRVLRVLARIIADLDELAGYPPIAAESRTEGKTAEARRARHRRRLAEPDPPPKRLTVQEERAALWDALGRPPHKRRR